MTNRGLERLTPEVCAQLLVTRSFGRVVVRIGDR